MSRRSALAYAVMHRHSVVCRRIWVPGAGWTPEAEARALYFRYQDYVKARKLWDHWDGWRSHPTSEMHRVALARRIEKFEREYPSFRFIYAGEHKPGHRRFA